MAQNPSNQWVADGAGVWGDSYLRHGVVGTSFSAAGVYGISDINNGVMGLSNSGHGLYGTSYSGHAVYANGKAHVEGNLTWKAKTITLEMDRQTLPLSFFSYVESWELFTEFEDFVKNRLK